MVDASLVTEESCASISVPVGPMPWCRYTELSSLHAMYPFLDGIVDVWLLCFLQNYNCQAIS